MAISVFTGWKTVTPGPCKECGSDDLYADNGRGVVFCNCQTCPGCLEFDGHAPHCPDVESERQRREDAWVERVTASLAFRGLHSCTSIDSDGSEFSWRHCDLCRTNLGGNRTRCNGYSETAREVVDVDSVCDDCLLFLANGDLPDFSEE